MGIDTPLPPQATQPPQIAPAQYPSPGTINPVTPPAPPDTPQPDPNIHQKNATGDIQASGRRSSQAGVDRTGTFITMLEIDRDAGRVAAISPQGPPVRGDVSTDLDYGLYTLKTDTHKQQWSFVSTQVKPGLRFEVDLEGVPNPFNLTYADSFPLVVHRGFQLSGPGTFATLKASVTQAVSEKRYEDAFGILDLLGEIDLYDVLDEMWLDDPEPVNALLLNFEKVLQTKQFDMFRLLRALEAFAVDKKTIYIDAFSNCYLHPSSFAKADPVREKLGETNIRLVFTFEYLKPQRAIMLFADDIFDTTAPRPELPQYGEGALLYPAYCTAATTPRMFEQKKKIIAQIETQNQEFFITAYNAVDSVINIIFFASGVMARTLSALQAGPRSATPITDAFQNQPGRWMPDFEAGLNMAEEDAAYEARVCNKDRAWGYYVNGVQFDGQESNLLIDAKNYADGKGMAKALARNSFWAGNKALGTAERQLAAAGKIPIEWRVSGQTATMKLQELFRVNKIPITVVYVP